MNGAKNPAILDKNKIKKGVLWYSKEDLQSHLSEIKWRRNDFVENHSNLETSKNAVVSK